MAIKVSTGVFEGLEAVRSSGLTNMFDRPKVILIAQQMGYYETAGWIEANKSDYAHGIFDGFDAQSDD